MGLADRSAMTSNVAGTGFGTAVAEESKRESAETICNFMVIEGLGDQERRVKVICEYSWRRGS